MNRIFKKFIFTFFVCIGSLTFGRELFPSEKSYYQDGFENNKKNVVENFKRLNFSNENYGFIQENLAKSKQEKNHHYYNIFTRLLAEYYNYHEDYKSLIQLYDDTINTPVYENSTSYLELLARYYTFFYIHSINVECDRILNKTMQITSQLNEKEAIYGESITQYLHGLRVKGNTIDVDQKNILRSIENLELTQKYFNEKDFNLLLALRYNQLAIAYIDKNQDDAISLFKKALRYCSPNDSFHRIIILSNLSYVYNLKNEPEKGLEFGLEGEKLALGANYKKISYLKLICNIHDSYRLLGQTEKALEYKTRCDSQSLLFKTKGEKISQNIQNYLTSNERKIKTTFIGNTKMLIRVGLIILIPILILFIFWKRKKRILKGTD